MENKSNNIILIFWRQFDKFNEFIKFKFEDNAAYIFAAIASCILSITTMHYKLIITYYDINFEFVVYLRSLSWFLICLPIIRQSKFTVYPPSKEVFKLHLIRSLIMLVNFVTYFSSILFLPIFLVQTINQTNTIWAVFASFLLVKDYSISLKQVFYIIGAFLGVIILVGGEKIFIILNGKTIEGLLKNQDDRNLYIGCALQLIAAITWAVISIFTHKITMAKAADSNVLLQYTNISGMIGSTILSLYLGNAPKLDTLLDWSFIANIIVYCSSGYIFGILNIQAFMLKKTSDILPIFYLSSFFNFIIDIVIFKVNFHFISVLGGILILLFCYLLVRQANK